MAQDGVGGIVERGAEDVGDDGLEGFGVVELGEVDDGVVGGFHACDLTDELLGLLVNGGSLLHVGNLLEDAYDETAHLAVGVFEVGIALQFVADIAADGVALTVEVLGKAVDGIIDKLVEAEGQAFKLLAQGIIHGLAFICFEPIHYAGDELGGGGEACCGIGSGTEDDEGVWAESVLGAVGHCTSYVGGMVMDMLLGMGGVG